MAVYTFDHAAMTECMIKRGYVKRYNDDGSVKTFDDETLAVQVRDLTNSLCAATSIKAYRLGQQEPGYSKGHAIEKILGLKPGALALRTEEKAA